MTPDQIQQFQDSFSNESVRVIAYVLRFSPLPLSISFNLIKDVSPVARHDENLRPASDGLPRCSGVFFSVSAYFVTP